MYQPISIKLLDFLIALSEALDLFSPHLSQHQIKTAFITWKLCEIQDLPPSRTEQCIVAALLHDIGALSPEDKVALHENEYEHDIKTHCDRGKKLLSQSYLFKDLANIIEYHHTPYEEWDHAQDVHPVIQSQILYLADTVERAVDRKDYILHQVDGIVDTIASKSVNEFHPDIVESFRELSSREDFWLDLVSNSIATILYNHSPIRQKVLYDSDFKEISIILRNIIDFRSPFTATHSTGVSSVASIIAQIMGLSESESEMLTIAGNLHDIGKLSVPNAILEKSGKLSVREYSIVKQHTYHTYAILNNCGLPLCILEPASFHHEKLNGEGYPFHVKSQKLTMGARILAAADILTALTEDRPYRKGMAQCKSCTIMKEMTDKSHIDPFIFDKIKNHYGDILESSAIMRKAVAEEYHEGAFDKYSA